MLKIFETYPKTFSLGSSNLQERLTELRETLPSVYQFIKGYDKECKSIA